MSNRLPEAERAAIRPKVLHAAARLFLEQGYAKSTTRGIAGAAGVNVSTMNKYFGSKENILCELVTFVLEGQFQAAQRLIAGKTGDKILYYAAETTLQLYMAEGSEAVRELYSVAYSMPHSSELIRRAVTEKLVSLTFQEGLPDLDDRDFYLREIASGGIILGYMRVPCSQSFPMEEKVRCFLEASLRIYQVPEEKIQEAIGFVKQFDYPVLAQATIAAMFKHLEESIL